MLRADEETCSLADGTVAGYAAVFPRPRVDRVAPGHLVALAGDLVVWRWYDAVVLGGTGGQVRLWEPGHGEVLATPRGDVGPDGSRAYASAGLRGADWWLAGPAVPVAEDAEVELDEVDALYTEHGLWDRLV